MFDNRHCEEKDLDLLNLELTKLKNILRKKDNQSLVNSQINEFLALIERFDKEIASSIKTQIKKTNSNIEIEKIIDTNMIELVQCINVDINEHKK